MDWSHLKKILSGSTSLQIKYRLDTKINPKLIYSSTSFSISVVRSCLHPQVAGVAGHPQQQDRQDRELLLPQRWLQPPDIRRQLQQHRRDPRHDPPARLEEHLPQQQQDQQNSRGEFQVSGKSDQGGATEQQPCDAS